MSITPGTDNTKLLNAVARDVLPLRGLGIRRSVVLREAAEGANLDATSRHGLLGVNDNSDPGILVILVLGLRVHINTREPAAVARVRVIPG